MSGNESLAIVPTSKSELTTTDQKTTNEDPNVAALERAYQSPDAEHPNPSENSSENPSGNVEITIKPDGTRTYKGSVQDLQRLVNLDTDSANNIVPFVRGSSNGENQPPTAPTEQIPEEKGGDLVPVKEFSKALQETPPSKVEAKQAVEALEKTPMSKVRGFFRKIKSGFEGVKNGLAETIKNSKNLKLITGVGLIAIAVALAMASAGTLIGFSGTIGPLVVGEALGSASAALAESAFLKGALGITSVATGYIGARMTGEVAAQYLEERKAKKEVEASVINFENLSKAKKEAFSSLSPEEFFSGLTEVYVKEGNEQNKENIYNRLTNGVKFVQQVLDATAQSKISADDARKLIGDNIHLVAKNNRLVATYPADQKVQIGKSGDGAYVEGGVVVVNSTVPFNERGVHVSNSSEADTTNSLETNNANSEGGANTNTAEVNDNTPSVPAEPQQPIQLNSDPVSSSPASKMESSQEESVELEKFDKGVKDAVAKASADSANLDLGGRVDGQVKALQNTLKNANSELIIEHKNSISKIIKNSTISLDEVSKILDRQKGEANEKYAGIGKELFDMFKKNDFNSILSWREGEVIRKMLQIEGLKKRVEEFKSENSGISTEVFEELLSTTNIKCLYALAEKRNPESTN